MRKLLEQTILHLRAKERVVWCVILAAEGSVPRGPGAKMAVFSDGSTFSTIGGGSVELQAAADAGTLKGKAAVRVYDLTGSDAARSGMVCGGSVTVGFVPFPADQAQALQSMLMTLDEPGAHWLRLIFEPDGVCFADLIPDPDAHSSQERPAEFVSLQKLKNGALMMTEPVSKQDRVYIFGAGHVSAALVPVLLPLGFQVTVYDPRPALTGADRFTGAQVICGEFSKLSEALDLSCRDYAVVMTPGHEMDLTVLAQVLKTPATYIGCIGSKRKTAYGNQKLSEAGFSESDIGRIHAPIGIPIHAKTPEEIAISIAAELILHRASGK